MGVYTPTRVLAGRHDRLFPLEFMRRLALERLNIVADVIDTGHLPVLSRLDELVRRLETYRLHHHGAPSVGRSRNLRSSAAPASGVQSSGLGGTPGRPDDLERAPRRRSDPSGRGIFAHPCLSLLRVVQTSLR